ncbi:hypothetical protein VC83_00386 [Pseudogymnoascus destructans]|uniref:Uncharacterized protein n=1 Tax=Pseudogymnoascus destructans TaxID=655981 RepID=A0A177ALB6_9PEZI|nr:uncharacterized protein VC83_00386 [Pseudogymnoascus destructans]OAF62859.1 hypothetical protein VC83_00386 [Pseudogymnoascus destructans]
MKSSVDVVIVRKTLAYQSRGATYIMEHGSGNSRKFFPYARRNVAEKSAKPGQECSARLGGSQHIASRRSGHHRVHAEGDEWEDVTVEEAEEAKEEAEEAGRRRLAGTGE